MSSITVGVCGVNWTMMSPHADPLEGPLAVPLAFVANPSPVDPVLPPVPFVPPTQRPLNVHVPLAHGCCWLHAAVHVLFEPQLRPAAQLSSEVQASPHCDP